MRILSRLQIESHLSIPEVIELIEQGFVAYSKQETVIPPVAALHFQDPPGECHIKYGYRKNGNLYIVKISSGFWENPKLGIPTGNGMMLLFDKRTGAPVAILLDEGYLTDVRTAAAGAVAAKYLAPKQTACIGIVGTGAQAFFQLKLLSAVTPCRKVLIWGRDRNKAQKLKEHPELREYQIEVAKELGALTGQCNLIVTTTSSSAPLLFAHHIQPGTHITAVGADDAGKQELDPEIFAKADQVAVDSRLQCSAFGDVSYAIKEGSIQKEKLVELGEIIIDPALRRTSESQITVADLTGLAVQDLQIATAVFARSN
jgi:ornithine cyclodeaminase